FTILRLKNTTMNKIFYTAFLIIPLLLGSCSGFLDKDPLLDPGAESVRDAASAIAMVNAAYQPLQRPKLYNMRIWTLDIMAGNSVVGAGGGDDGIETVQLANFTTGPDNFAAVDLWRGPNPGILYCNTVLENVPSMAIDQTLKNRLIG